jgi:hypothetical protein
MYTAPNLLLNQELAVMNIGTPTFMRAPGEAPGMWALESAMDELAWALKIDPIDLRLKNEAKSISARACHSLPSISPIASKLGRSALAGRTDQSRDRSPVMANLLAGVWRLPHSLVFVAKPLQKYACSRWFRPCPHRW